VIKNLFIYFKCKDVNDYLRGREKTLKKYINKKQKILKSLNVLKFYSSNGAKDIATCQPLEGDYNLIFFFRVKR